MDKEEIQKIIDNCNHDLQNRPKQYTPLLSYIYCCICFEALSAENATINDNKVVDICQKCSFQEYKQGMEVVRDLRHQVRDLENRLQKAERFIEKEIFNGYSSGVLDSGGSVGSRR